MGTGHKMCRVFFCIIFPPLENEQIAHCGLCMLYFPDETSLTAETKASKKATGTFQECLS